MTLDRSGDDRAEIPVVRLDSPSAKQLADIVSIHRDLAFVVECCDRLLALLDRDDRDPVATRAFFSAALVAYVRCWSTGVRQGLATDVLEAFDGEPEAFHQVVKDMRDKHIAHAVNPFERVAVGVAIARSADGSPDFGVSQLVAELVSFDSSFVSSLRAIAVRLAANVAERGEVLTASVRTDAAAEGVESLLRRPRLGLAVPGREHAAQSRTQDVPRRTTGGDPAGPEVY
jgi:hypothetical protein